MSSIKERYKMLPKVKLSTHGDNFIIEIGHTKPKMKYYVSWVEMQAKANGGITGKLEFRNI